MKPSEILAAKADEIRAVIARYPVRNPRIFGSVARGEDQDGSDLDILVEPLEGTTYFDLAGLELELADLLGIKIDLATPGALRGNEYKLSEYPTVALAGPAQRRAARQLLTEVRAAAAGWATRAP